MAGQVSLSLLICLVKSCCDKGFLAVLMAPSSVIKAYEGVRVIPKRLDILVLVSMTCVNSMGLLRVNARRSVALALIPTPTKVISGCLAAAVRTIVACCLHAAQDGSQNHNTVGLPHKSSPENPLPSSDWAMNCSCQGNSGSDVSVDACGLAADICCDVNSVRAGEHPVTRTAAAMRSIALFFKAIQLSWLVLDLSCDD